MSPRSEAVSSTSAEVRRPALGIILLALLSAQTAQQSLGPLLAPFGRETGLSEVQVGLVMTVGAGTFSISSLIWGRIIDRWGTRRSMIVGMLLAVAGLTGFAVVANLALALDTSPTLTWVMMVLTRSLLFGLGMGAIPVAAMAHIAATTDGVAERTKGLGQMGAIQGVALALGPALGAVLALAGLLGPVWAAPLLVLAALVLVVRRVPAVPVLAPERRPAASGLRPWDPRIRGFLLIGFTLFSSLAMVVIVMGFAFQDRLHLTGAQTVQQVGAATFVTGVVMIAGQGFVVPRLGWAPLRLLGVGVPVASVGMIAMAFAGSFATLVISLAVMSVGMALGMPGYTAGASLQVDAHEQGALSGLVNATNGLTFALGPLVGTALYQVRGELPMLAAGLMCLLAAGVLLVDRLRQPAVTRG